MPESQATPRPRVVYVLATGREEPGEIAEVGDDGTPSSQPGRCRALHRHQSLLVLAISATPNGPQRSHE
jgi:hypothetical protein